MEKIFLFVLLLGIGMTQCKVEENTQKPKAEFVDTHSYAESHLAKTRHLDLDLQVDFETQTLTGFARHKIINNQADRFVVDIRDLDIHKVTVGKEEKEVKFNLSSPKPHLGQALHIPIEPHTDIVTIYYATQPKAAALDWLKPEQTADKKMPFLYTQGQAILTRTWIPLQDSPGIRITYDATIRVPEGMMAVMSAANPQKINLDGIYQFAMQQPIPAYLMALAVGELAFLEVGPRTGVYAEPSVVEKAQYEFGDMEKMLVSAEKLYGPYLWDRYDVIVLPPSFPFGGMENPRLTFATPTILAGDRSLTALIAHELAHSWSGNLVTNATWNDFWLNEGFTVYFERRIMEALYGKEYTDMLTLLGYQDLENTVRDLGSSHADTHLFLDLEDRDPDDGMTDIAYEKGSFFLTAIEREVGRETFDRFLKEYFEKFKFQSMSTDAFIDHLKTALLKPNNLDFDFERWIFGPGIPENCPQVTTERFANVEKHLGAFLDGQNADAMPTQEWTTHEWLHFLRKVPREIEMAKLADLDQAFGLSTSGNSEILNEWFDLSIRSGYVRNNLDQIEDFLINVGRRKFLSPIYRAFKESGQVDTAKAIFEKARSNYHSVSAGSIEELLAS